MSTVQCWPAGKFLNRKKPQGKEVKKARAKKERKSEKQCARYLTILEELREKRRKKLSGRR